MSYNELTNAGNVKWSRAEGGGIRLDVDPLASLILAAIDAAEVKEGGERIVGEVGSNENGSWVRFGNGLQVCWHEASDTTTATNATGGVFYSTPVNFTYPQSFQTAPLVIPRARRAGTGIVVWATLQNAGTSSCGIYAVASTSTTPGYLGYVAIGRWK